MMFFQKVSLGIFVALLTLSAETITLQQGVDGYTGCEDSYIESMSADGYNGASENHGDEPYIAAGHLSYKIS